LSSYLSGPEKRIDLNKNSIFSKTFKGILTMDYFGEKPSQLEVIPNKNIPWVVQLGQG